MCPADARPADGPAFRARAARAVDGVRRQGRPLDEILGTGTPPLVRELAFGTCRHYFSLRGVVDARLSQPLRDRDQDVYALLLVGLYQLRHLRIPDHAAVSETVAAAGLLRKPWARALVNGVLRREARTATPPTSDEARLEHPAWLIEALQAAWPEHCPELFEANNTRAPMAIRVNRTKNDVLAYRALLDAAELAHRPGLAPASLVLETPVPATRLPGYDKGWVAVQDEAAQLATTLLPCRGGARVLDACAAPGGKTFALLENEPALALTALDASDDRLGRLRADAERLGHRPARVTVGDATDTTWWDGTPFDAILLDAPCSSTGTLRRHPDIKVSRTPGHVRTAARRQREMLGSLWGVLSSGGTLLYCTCSILPEENDAVMEEFLAATPDAAPAPVDAPWGRPTEHGRVLLPSPGGPDGFYFSRIVRKSRGAQGAAA